MDFKTDNYFVSQLNADIQFRLVTNCSGRLVSKCYVNGEYYSSARLRSLYIDVYRNFFPVYHDSRDDAFFVNLSREQVAPSYETMVFCFHRLLDRVYFPQTDASSRASRPFGFTKKTLYNIYLGSEPYRLGVRMVDVGFYVKQALLASEADPALPAVTVCVDLPF